jgi:hypothetical protein
MTLREFAWSFRRISRSVRCSVVFATLVFSDTAWANNGGVCEADPAVAELVRACQDRFRRDGCTELAREAPARVTTCSPDEMSRSRAQNVGQLIGGCGDGAWRTVEETVRLIPELPGMLARAPGAIAVAVEKNAEFVRQARRICDERLAREAESSREVEEGLRFFEGRARDSERRRLVQQYVGRRIDRCRVDEAHRLRGPLMDLPKKLEELDRMRLCFKPEEQANVVCGAITGIVGGAGVQVAVRGAVRALARPGAVSALGARADETLARLRGDRDARVKERLSVAHQDDMIRAIDANPALQEVIRRAGIDRDALRAGIVDSDMGKFGSQFSGFLARSPDGEAVFDALRLQGQTPAAQAMRELMARNGMQGRGLLPPGLSNDQIRAVFNQPGANGLQYGVLRGYLHELPGMAQAIADVNAGRITSAQFQRRIAANMFHNGPNAGFWQNLNDLFVPGALKNGTHPEARDFFRGTVFERDTVDGVTRPRYPGPISSEGALHTTLDRLSQATRGGYNKILHELVTVPDAALATTRVGSLGPPLGGLNGVRNLLAGNPNGPPGFRLGNTAQTLSQFDALDAHVRQMANLNPAQRDALLSVVRDGRGRLERLQQFMNQNMRIENQGPDAQRIVFEYNGPNGRVRRELTNDSNVTDVSSAMDDFLRAEERLNGEPFESLLRGPQARAGMPLVGAGVGASLGVAVNCPINRAPPARGDQRRMEGEVQTTQ